MSRPLEPLAHQVFESLAADQPDAVALVQGEVRLSYGELNARANRLARQLRALGAKPETVVGVNLDRTPDFVVAELAILKVGAAFLPLDTGYPAARLDTIVRDSGAALVIHRGAVTRGVPGLDLARSDTTISARSAANLDVDVPRAALAYIIYTSGSTGTPKGVQVEHAQLAAVLATLPDVFGLGRHSRCLQASPFAFDMALGIVFCVLVTGGTVVLADAADAAQPDRLAEIAAEQHVDTVVLPPSVLAALPEPDLPGLRTVCAAGEACAVSIEKRFSGGRRFVNAYGPTETTVVATAYVTTGSEGPRTTPGEVPIGSALPGAKVYVLDDEGQHVRPGETGDIYIGGTGVSRGYRGRPAATAERFVPDPYAGNPGSRMYRTGDLGQLPPGSGLQFRGRNDHQVKINGYRIELGEVERVLETHPAVRQAVVVVTQSLLSRPQLRGFVILGDSAEDPDLRGFMAERVPQPLIPPMVIPVAGFPLTANGKVDRSSLARMEIHATAQPREFLPPQTPSQAIIAAEWALALGVPRVGRLDDFFQLGGDSVTAGKLVTRLRQALGVELPIRAFFEPALTVESLAAAVESGKFAMLPDPGRPISRRSPRPLTIPQEGDCDEQRKRR